MPTKIEHFNVNWMTGMKINRDHFIQQENAFKDHLKDAYSIGLNNKNYGLLPLDIPNEESYKVEITLDNENFLKVKIFQYRSVSQGGGRVEILKDHLLPEFKLDLSTEIGSVSDSKDNGYFVVLSMNLFERQNFGELKTDEEPPRFPYIIPEYKVHLISEDQIQSDSYQPFTFFMGKLYVKGDKIEIYDNYIPPCMRISSHTALISFLIGIIKQYDQIESNLVSIIRKIKEKQQDTTLAQSVLTLSEDLLKYISHNHVRLQWEMNDLPLVYLLQYIATTAHVIKNAIDTKTASDKEELLNYFTGWTELKQGDFEKLIKYCINFNYQHFNIQYSVEQFSEFMQVISLLFKKLESLTYIGKKKETNIFVKEQKTKRSFLAD
ncbi:MULTISPECIES: hypothetical protein [unclassified Saccharicrinis]|uniref:hypothetical protein n=1 Tax=unclassified Saccharicrinis TaxID=2646859 RepID=UPI003D341237